MTEQSKAGNPPELTIERVYVARVEELWDLWTTKSGFESWWGPQGFRTEVDTLEARPGGLLAYWMIAADAEQIAAMQKMGMPTRNSVRATFTEVKPHEHLVITNVIDFVPGVQPYESTIAVSFHPMGRSVRMVTKLAPMHAPEWTQRQVAGYTSQLTKLDQRFTAGP